MSNKLDELSGEFRKRGFEVFTCSNKKEAVNAVTDIVKNIEQSGLKVGFGNSETLRALNLIELVSGIATEVNVHNPRIDTEDADRRALLSDMYFTSANAVSSDGFIVNIDGTGNRTAATCFGPKHVIFVIGKNKIVKTLNDAIDRAKNVAAVGIAKKYGRKTPCVYTGKCEECQSPECVCGVMTIHRRQLRGNKITVILVDEDLGI